MGKTTLALKVAAELMAQFCIILIVAAAQE